MKFATLRSLTLAFAFVFSIAWASAQNVTELEAKGSFEEARQALTDAVVNRGYKIDYEAFIGAMLDRTGDDVGSAKPIYKEAQFIQFCSAVLSRKAMEADPANIAFCPYVLFVYERTDEPGKPRLGFRRLPETGSDASKASLAKVNEVLEEIVTEAAEGW